MSRSAGAPRIVNRWSAAAVVIGSTAAMLISPLALGSASAATTAVAVAPGTTTTMAHGGTATVNYTVTTDDGTESAATSYSFVSGPDAAGPNPTLNCAAETGPTANVYSGSCTFTNLYAGAGPDVLRITNGGQHVDASVALTGARTTTTSVSVDANSQNIDQPAGTTAVLHVHYSPVPSSGQDAPLVYLTTLNGPNSTGTDGAANPAGSLCQTKLDGTAICSLTNSNGAGQDNVVAFADNNSDGALSGTAPADAQSTNTVVTFSGSPAAVNISAPRTTATVGTCVVYTIAAVDSLGHPSASAAITVTVNELVAGTPATPVVTFFSSDCTSGADARAGARDNGDGTFSISQTKVVTTGPDGSVKVGIAVGNPSSGNTSNVTAAASATVSSSVPMTWTPGGANAVARLSAAPTTRTQYANTLASYTVTAADSGGNPVQGVQVNRETVSGPDSVNSASCGTTDANGAAVCSVQNFGSTGTDQLIFWVDNTAPGTHTSGPDANEPQTTASATFNAQPAFTSSGLGCVQQLAGSTQGTPVSNCTVPTAQKSLTFTETLKNNGAPVPGAIVDFAAIAATLGGQGVSAANLPTASATTDANGNATFVISDPNAANGDTVAVRAKVGGVSVGSAAGNWQTPVASALSVRPALQSLTKGGTVFLTAQITDQFGSGVSGADLLKYAVAGRNAGQGTVTTDPSGLAQISYVDTGTSGTSDTISVADQTHPFNGSAQVQYVNGSTAAASVTVDTSGSGTADGTCAAGGHAPATNVTAGTVTEVCVLVKNSGGEALAGKTVVLNVSNGAVSKQTPQPTTSTTTATVTTDVAGVAFAYVSSTKSGVQTVSATVDAATGSSTVTYAAPSATLARNIKIAPASGVLTAGAHATFTATVTDAFGNPVPSVSVQFTQSGPGSIGGASSAVVTTASDGTASVTLSTASTDSGSGSVVASIAAGSSGSQCGAAAGQGAPPASTAGNCTATATYTVSKGTVPASLLVQAAGPHKVGDQELLAATVTNSDGTPAVNQLVRFTISGANTASGSGATTPKGVAFIAYTPTNAGTDHVSAFDDLNNNGVKDVGEPSGTLSLTIVSGAGSGPGVTEKPTIRLTSRHGQVTVHVVSHPSLAHAVVTYYLRKKGVFRKIGTNHTGSAGRAHMTFREPVGAELVFRAKVGSGTSARKSIKVRA